MSIKHEELPLEQEGQAYNILQSKLGDSGMQMLDEQLSIWDELNSRELNNPLRDSLDRRELVLPKGTFMHGVRFDADILGSMSRIGVVSGELLGKVEDAETHGCADFFKVPQDMTLEEYFDWAKTPVTIGALKAPRGEKNYLREVAIIIDPQTEGVAPLLEHDAYTDSQMGEFTNLPSRRTPEDTSAILGGMPRGSIAVIVLGERIAGDPAKVAEVISLFPQTPVLNHAGESLQQPAQAA